MAERPLFPEPTNPDPRPRGWHEPISDYLARSTMPVAVELREWLRRNDDYDEDFQELGDAGADTKALTDKIRRRWGLRFPHRPAGTSV